MDGIADNVRIMSIRAVPGGDEHDKDVALAIRYAVDNGAKIINMSFGKPVSPYKQFVDDAIRVCRIKRCFVGAWFEVMMEKILRMIFLSESGFS